jgi:hypothetical protein
MADRLTDTASVSVKKARRMRWPGRQVMGEPFMTVLLTNEQEFRAASSAIR